MFEILRKKIIINPSHALAQIHLHMENHTKNIINLNDVEVPYPKHNSLKVTT